MYDTEKIQGTLARKSGGEDIIREEKKQKPELRPLDDKLSAELTRDYYDVPVKSVK